MSLSHHTRRMSRMSTSCIVDRRKAVRSIYDHKLQLSAMDLLVLASMKNAANCDK